MWKIALGQDSEFVIAMRDEVVKSNGVIALPEAFASAYWAPLASSAPWETRPDRGAVSSSESAFVMASFVADSTDAMRSMSRFAADCEFAPDSATSSREHAPSATAPASAAHTARAPNRKFRITSPPCRRR